MKQKKKPKSPLVPVVDINENLKIESVKEEFELPQGEKTGRFLFVLGSIVAVLVIVVAGLISMVYFSQKKEKIVETNLMPTVTPIITETPKISLKKEEILFDVFNATNVGGEAKKYKKILENIGFKVKTTGNEKGQFEGISLFLPKEMENQKEALLDELKKEIPSIKYAGQNENSNTVKIIIGK